MKKIKTVFYPKLVLFLSGLVVGTFFAANLVVFAANETPRYLGFGTNFDTNEIVAPAVDINSGDGSNEVYIPSGQTNKSNKALNNIVVSMPNFLQADTIPQLLSGIADFILKYIALPFAVLMMIWAGFRFVTAQGQPEAINKAKKNFIWTIAGVALILAANLLVGFVTDFLGGGGGQVSSLLSQVKSTLNIFIGFLFTLVTVYFFWGIVEFVRSTGAGNEEGIKKGKSHMVWGIIGMAIMGAARGIVEIITNYLQ
ncbi:MAG: pilin [Candidatus Portnoybacteria bacterium]|jgi:hypothetical protein|nr:pilin [Candidatus Portnoybacteria bacterium]